MWHATTLVERKLERMLGDAADAQTQSCHQHENHPPPPIIVITINIIVTVTVTVNNILVQAHIICLNTSIN